MRLHPSLLALLAAIALAPPPAPAGGPFVRVLGTAQDGGFPHVACDHELCHRARQDGSGRRIAALAIVLPGAGAVYLVDATPDIREQLAALADVRRAPGDRVDRAPVAGVFLTHAHVGHYLGLAFFGYEAVNASRLPVWASPKMGAFLAANAPWSLLVERANVELRQLEPGGSVALGDGVRVEAVAAPHRDELSDTLALRVSGPRSTLLYVPDTDSWAAWQRPLTEILEGVDVALLDGTFFSARELPGRDVAEIGHPLVTDTLERLDGTGPRVLFTHLNHSNPALDAASPERARIRAGGCEVAEDGQEFPL